MDQPGQHAWGNGTLVDEVEVGPRISVRSSGDCHLMVRRTIYGNRSCAAGRRFLEFWTRPHLSLGSFGLTVIFLARAVVFLLLLWLGTKVVSTIFRTHALDRTTLNQGRKFSLQRVVAYLFFGLGAPTGLHALG